MPCAMSWCAVVPGWSGRRTGGDGIGVAPSEAGSAETTLPGRGYSPLQYAPELSRCEYHEPRSLLRRSIVQRCIAHQLGSVSLVGSTCGARGGGVPLACAFMAAATAAAICSSRVRSAGAGGAVVLDGSAAGGAAALRCS